MQASRPRVAAITFWHSYAFLKACVIPPPAEPPRRRSKSSGRAASQRRISPVLRVLQYQKICVQRLPSEGGQGRLACGPSWLALVLKCGP